MKFFSYKIDNTQRSSNECCDKWKDLCRSIQFGESSTESHDQYDPAERVKYLLDEIVNNQYANDKMDDKSLPPTLLQNDDYFEIMV